MLPLLVIVVRSVPSLIPMFRVLVPAVAMFTFWSTLSLPTLSAPPLELICIAPLASRSTEAVLVVDSARESLMPMIVEPPSCRFTPPVPLRVKAPALVDHVAAAADVTVSAPADVARVPASVRVMSPSRNKSCHAAAAEPKSYESSLAGIRCPVGLHVVSQTGSVPSDVRTAPAPPTPKRESCVVDDA